MSYKTELKLIYGYTRMKKDEEMYQEPKLKRKRKKHCKGIIKIIPMYDEEYENNAA